MSNRRLVLLDQEETPNYAGYYGCGLGNEIYTVQQLSALSVDEETAIIRNLGPGDAIMSVGAKPFAYIKSIYHLGIRRENHSDVSLLYRLSMEGGAFLKQVQEFPSQQVIAEFLSDEFTKQITYSGFNHRLISTVSDAIEFIKEMDSLPDTQHYGFDYETSGLALDKEFWVSGLSIVTETTGAFISFSDIRRELGGEDNDDFRGMLKIIGDFLVKRMNKIWTYNVQFEWQVSNRIFGVDLYNLCDASVVNTMDGYHMKKYSLKWTAQRVLGVNVWDSEFDRIEELIDSMYYTTEGKLKRDKKKIIKISGTDFKDTPEWKELERRYPQDIQEMEILVNEYWGHAFMVPSSRILGLYCCLDSLYTLLIAKSRFDTYSDDCWNVNLDNARLGARLMGSGLYIDEPFRNKYEIYSQEQQAWAITYCAMARCYVKSQEHKKRSASKSRFSPVAQKLLIKDKFFSGNIMDITKFILSDNIDHLDSSESGLDEGKLLIEYGQEFAENLLKIVDDARTEIKMKDKLDENVGRKKKLLGIVSEKLFTLLGLDGVKIDNRVLELEKHLTFQRAYEELEKVTKKQLNDISNVPTKIRAFGQTFTLSEYSKFVSDNYFKCKSPEENDKIALEFTMMFRAQTSFLAAMFESVQQVPNTDKFWSSRGIGVIDDAYKEFMAHWENYAIHRTASDIYPNKPFDLAKTYYQDPKSDSMKDMWTNLNGYIAQSQYFPSVSDQYLEYEKPFCPSDFKDGFFFMRKLCLNYLVFKKYAKLESTYIGSDGMFKKNNKFVIEGPNRIPIRYADPDEPGAVEKCFVHYEVMTKSSKRWSSGFHTIISHGDCKDVLCPPPSWDENGQIIYGGSNQLLTYFDISSAEVKAAGYASMDPDLIAKFDSGEDIYIYSAILYLKDKWDALTPKERKKWRKRFKTVFLGVLYGLGKNSLAERLDASLEEADDIIQSLYQSFPQLRNYVNEQGEYPLNHDGFVNTMLGDKVRLKEWTDFLPKAKSKYEENNIIARIKRLGVNLPIQGGTSSIMACGFYNNIRQSLIEGWKVPLQPIIVVHDSNTNYVPVDKLFEISEFYQTHYTDFCSKIGPKIKLLFDLLMGYSYEMACPIKMLSDGSLEVSGSALAILKFYDKVQMCSFPVTCSMSREDIVDSIKLVNSPYQRFILEGGCNMTKDLSKLKVTFKRA